MSCLRLASGTLIFGVLILGSLSASIAEERSRRPNILWITSEDNGPQLGCYGDKYATTPHIDDLAKRGTVFKIAWSSAPVCAPARTAIITGMYPNSLGAQHMRSNVPLPRGVKLFPQILREAGYYCTNNSKEDYNVVKPDGVWDRSSRKAHWRDRGKDQPFFAVFNITTSHESQIRKRPHRAVHDPADVRVPAYHPDRPEVRRDWAQYYDKLTEMDRGVGRRLKEIEDAGLADDTIVFYFGDHGPGMPRSKRWPFNSGLHVPMVIYLPKRFRENSLEAGGATDRLVSFVDLAPTVLSLAGIRPAPWMQGKAFLGKFSEPPHQFIHGFRDRMDERYDLVRSIRDRRYAYLRHFLPHRVYGQHVWYQRQTPTDRVWKSLFDAGKLNATQSAYWKVKPSEELFDLVADPDETVNLAGSPEHQKVLERFRSELTRWTTEIRDVGFLPEAELHRRAAGKSPFDVARQTGKYDFERIAKFAWLVTDRSRIETESLLDGLHDSDSAIRFWAVTGIQINAERLPKEVHAKLNDLVGDHSPSVAIAAAEFVVQRSENEPMRSKALNRLIDFADLESQSLYVCLEALNAIDRLDALARPKLAELKQLPRNHKKVNGRMKNLVNRLLEKILLDLES